MAILGRIPRFLILAGITYHSDEENALNQVSVKIKDWPVVYRRKHKNLSKKFWYFRKKQ